MQQRDVLKPGRVKDLGYRVSYPFIEPMHPGMDQRRTFIVDQELVERDPRRWDPRRNAMDPSDDVVNTCTRLLHVDPVSYQSLPPALGTDDPCRSMIPDA